MANQKLTNDLVKKLPEPPKGSRIYYDSEEAGLGVRITTKGARAYVFNYRTRSGDERRFTIGAADPAVRTVAQAREDAKKLRRIVEDGGDPQRDRTAVRAAPMVDELADRYLGEHTFRNPRARYETDNTLRQW